MEILREPKFYPNKNEICMNVKVQVDTKELEEAIEKANYLEKKLEYLSKVMNEKDKTKDNSSSELALILAACQTLLELQERLK